MKFFFPTSKKMVAQLVLQNEMLKSVKARLKRIDKSLNMAVKELGEIKRILRSLKK